MFVIVYIFENLTSVCSSSHNQNILVVVRMREKKKKSSHERKLSSFFVFFSFDNIYIKKGRSLGEFA